MMQGTAETQTGWYRLLRPTILGLIGLAVAVMVAELLGSVYSSSDPTALERHTARLRQPAPELTPSDVVRIQLSALASPEEPQSVLQCISFASPENRALTGPLARFGRMMQSPPFDVFHSSKDVLIGKMQMIGDRARIFVSVLDEDAEPRGFLWVLGKQDSHPFAGCWMTEAVMNVRVSGEMTDDEAKRKPVI